MSRVEDGWFSVTAPDARPGDLYRFRLPDGMLVPDPASRFQPEDVHGPSELVDPAAYPWADSHWTGRPWAEAVVYELHLGAFTAEGTFQAAIERLPHLVLLGVTAIEIMPVADFPGRRNWGYDGVLPYAPDSAYGRPEDFKALVDAAHGLGLSVLLDVVYNHFGPDGNYLPVYAPPIFTKRHKTPWGAAVNYDGPDSGPVRDLVIENALYWLDDFHLDGLRLDAVHAIKDDSQPPLLQALAERVRATDRGRPIHLVLENEDNQARWLQREADGAPRLYTAQWNDDVHHVLHVAATGEDRGYYVDYLGDTERLGRALAEGFAFQGELMGYRGSKRGEPSADLPPTAFMAFLQNHDQIGNRAFGERLTALAPPAAVRAVSAVYLLLPEVPMLFMGEEWDSARPFPFFCDFDGKLGEAVRKGRRAEFKRFPEFQDAATRERIPDPLAEGTFLSAKLDWEALETPAGAAALDWRTRILAVRRAEIIPLLSLPSMGRVAGPQGLTGGEPPPLSPQDDNLSTSRNPTRPLRGLPSPLRGRDDQRSSSITGGGAYVALGPSAVRVTWRVGDQRLSLEANLSSAPLKTALWQGREIWREGEVAADGLGPWAVRWTIGEA